ncbi:MAG: DNA-binding protein WhiA [Clostridia bacterium]|nr:DNA-binding protein WhiA [Clostridia bacterium]
MSFSTETKEELSKTNNLANKEQVQAEFIGYLISSNTSIVNQEIKYATESEYNINRFSKLLNNMQILDYQINLQGKLFVITFEEKEIEKFEKLLIINKDCINLKTKEFKENYFKALIRGAFLGSGSINNPKAKYHLEISLSTKENREIISNKLFENGIIVKTLDGKNSYPVYIKDGEEISKFLAFIGANQAVLKFEEVRVVRQMNNKVNRLVNCETANMNKTINAAVEQINAIQKLKKAKKFDKLEDSLKEIAEIRLEHPNEPLSELGNYLKNPIGKSGVNYRLKKIIEISQEN